MIFWVAESETIQCNQMGNKILDSLIYKSSLFHI